MNREEIKFALTSSFSTFSKLVTLFFGAICILLGSTILDDDLDSKLGGILMILSIVCVALIFLLSIINYFLKPPYTIFLSYEKYLREEIGNYLAKVTSEGKYGKGCKYKIANNDALWIEIDIPHKLRMEYDEFEIKKHLDYLNLHSQIEDGDAYEQIMLYEVVDSAEEAEEHNKKM